MAVRTPAPTSMSHGRGTEEVGSIGRSSKTSGLHPDTRLSIRESPGIEKRRHRTGLPRIGTILVRNAISSTTLNGKWLLSIADAAKQ